MLTCLIIFCILLAGRTYILNISVSRKPTQTQNHYDGSQTFKKSVTDMNVGNNSAAFTEKKMAPGSCVLIIIIVKRHQQEALLPTAPHWLHIYQSGTSCFNFLVIYCCGTTRPDLNEGRCLWQAHKWQKPNTQFSELVFGQQWYFYLFIFPCWPQFSFFDNFAK